MKESASKLWGQPQPLQLVSVLSAIEDPVAMQSFLRDVLTEKEIIEISARLEAARMLAAGERYVDITKNTKLSSRTIARISDWMQNGCNGYATALSLTAVHHAHIPPARAR